MINRKDIIDASSKYYHQYKKKKNIKNRIVTTVKKKKNVAVRAEEATGPIMVSFY